MDPKTVNREIFGHDSFRPGQETLIDAILAGRDCLGVMPTGGGKSLCYQVPALILPGLTLVISPLISLMKDQVASLTKRGVPAAFWNSTMSDDERRSVRRGVERGEYKLLYIAPERLESQAFTQLMARCRISMVTVDEAHCVSQWGQDFRPSYMKIADFIDALPVRPVVAAFTATATEDVRQDIIDLLRLRDPQMLVTGFDRPNLYFGVLWTSDKEKTIELEIEERQGCSGIVYCPTRPIVEEVCQALRDAGVDATMYHAKLSIEERRKNQEDFQYDRASVMVATNAFGMGIDKPDVSYVIHYSLPTSMEAYYQEAGRAGRDKEPGDCILLYDAAKDEGLARFLLDHREMNADLTEDQEFALRDRDNLRLEDMVAYCESEERCYRGMILDYFGQEHGKTCGYCGECGRKYTKRDITVPAQMILSCVHRVHNLLGYYGDIPLIVKTLRGSKDEQIRSLGLDKLSTYGLLKEEPRWMVSAMVNCLRKEGYVEQKDRFGALIPTDSAKDVLFHGRQVEMRVTRTAAGA